MRKEYLSKSIRVEVMPLSLVRTLSLRYWDVRNSFKCTKLNPDANLRLDAFLTRNPLTAIVPSTKGVIVRSDKEGKNGMAVIRNTKEYDGISANEGFQVAEAAFRQADFDVWKSRPQGWLAMAKFQDTKGVIQANFACRPGATTSVTLTLKSEVHEEEELQEHSERLFAFVDAQLTQA